MQIFITGIAGFIGFHCAQHFIKLGYSVSGCDTFNSYYDVKLKEERARILEQNRITVHKWDCADLPTHLNELKGTTHILHLAAQAGVRYSLSAPKSYIDNNIVGTFGVLEACKDLPDVRLIFASSSSVYGLNKKLPFSEDDVVVQPANLYAATKLSTEHLAFSYHAIYGIPMCGLRFFTVYGTYGRPDMACFLFADKILRGDKVPLFNEGKMRRDFTHISDIVDGITATLSLENEWEILNLSCANVESVETLVSYLESGLGKKAMLELLPMQPGEMIETQADITKAQRLLGYSPKVSLKDGIAEFTKWFLSRNA